MKQNSATQPKTMRTLREVKRAAKTAVEGALWAHPRARFGVALNRALYDLPFAHLTVPGREDVWMRQRASDVGSLDRSAVDNHLERYLPLDVSDVHAVRRGVDAWLANHTPYDLTHHLDNGFRDVIRHEQAGTARTLTGRELDAEVAKRIKKYELLRKVLVKETIRQVLAHRDTPQTPRPSAKPHIPPNETATRG